MVADGKVARNGLREAAVRLFTARGFDDVTAEQIAAEAGVNRRTFFRHFPDKRDVLFEEEALLSALTEGLNSAPEGLSALGLAREAIHATQPVIEENRASAETRQRLIAAHPALRERALAKASTLVETLANGIEARGIEPRTAHLAAQTAITASALAVADWYADPSRSFNEHVDLILDKAGSLFR